jgi:hypothetical protein
MIRSPISASAISTVRRRSPGMRSTSVSLLARASARRGGPASMPASARKPPGPSSMMSRTWPRPSRALRPTDPEIRTNIAELMSPTLNSISPAA